MTTARQLAAVGVKIYRAGVWKPRTKPGGFEGVGSPALKWMMQAEKETGMYMATEVATGYVYEALKFGVDILWIGARTAANPFAVQEMQIPSRCGYPHPDQKPCESRPGLWIGHWSDSTMLVSASWE